VRKLLVLVDSNFGKFRISRSARHVIHALGVRSTWWLQRTPWQAKSRVKITSILELLYKLRSIFPIL